MVKRIDLFMPPLSQYGVLHHFTQKFSEGLKSRGVSCRILEAEHHNPKPFLDALFGDKPDCTLSFNGLLPDDQGRFFCDLVQIPHVACLVDSPNRFVDLVKSPYTIITCIDKSHCDFFRGMNFPNVIFLPHGADSNLPPPNPNRPLLYDVVVLASCIDYDKLRSTWAKKYSPAVAKLMDEAAEVTLSDSHTTYVEAISQALDTALKKPNAPDPTKIDFITLLDDLEFYIDGKDRVELVRNITDARIDVFGAADGTATWKKYLGESNSNVVYHEPVPFEQALDVMTQTKILLNSTPTTKHGSHERLFSGLASGALVLTAETPYISQTFKNGENIACYELGKWHEANAIVNHYLHDDRKRNFVVEKGYGTVMRYHTWAHRAEELLKHLDPILSSLVAKR